MNVEFLEDEEKFCGVELEKLNSGECFTINKNKEYFIATNQTNGGTRTVMGMDGSLHKFGVRFDVKPVKAILTIDLRKDVK